MNSSSASDAARTVHGCDQVISQGSLDHTTPEAYAWLVFVTFISIITSPITFSLNALIIIAVKTKHRVKTKSNLAIASLSSTDGIMGVIGQPLFTSWVTAELQGNTSSTYCIRTLLSRIALRVLGIASLSHLAMMNVERYIAIKHPLQYETIVTENRLTCLSVLLLITDILLTVPLSFVDNNIYLTVDNSTMFLCIAIIFYCQIVLYYETRRHQKEIAAQQVSLETREKFLKEKKAFKLTTTVLFFLILCYLPLILARTLISKSVIKSVNLAYIALFAGIIVAIFNSIVNPIIYCVRIRQFRVAFIQLVFRKSNTQAENVEKRVFGRLNRVMPHQEVYAEGS